MIILEPTPNLTGLYVKGDFKDFDELVDTIHRMTNLDEYGSNWESYHTMCNRLLGLCYDVRHAIQGDRDIEYVRNGYGILEGAPKENLYYKCEVLFPEAIFIAASIKDLTVFSRRLYGKKVQEKYGEHMPSLTDYYKDAGYLLNLSGLIFCELAKILGEDEFEKIMKIYDAQEFGEYLDYLRQYIDYCNVEYVKTPVEKRKAKLKTITRRLLKRQSSYYNQLEDYTYWAKKYKCPISKLENKLIDYPEGFKW